MEEQPSALQTRISWVFQLIAALILGNASIQKFLGVEMSVYVFKALDIEGTRLVIGAIEGVAALLLLTKAPHWGAILGFSTMLGALIAHISVLGLEVHQDHGALSMMMIGTIVSTAIVLWIRRRSLPLIGHTFDS